MNDRIRDPKPSTTFESFKTEAKRTRPTAFIASAGRIAAGIGLPTIGNMEASMVDEGKLHHLMGQLLPDLGGASLFGAQAGRQSCFANSF